MYYLYGTGSKEGKRDMEVEVSLSTSIAQHEDQKVTEPRGDMQQARAVASPFTATAAEMETA